MYSWGNIVLCTTKYHYVDETCILYEQAYHSEEVW
jgi:hypothetical protein